MPGTVDLGVADDRECAGSEQTAQVAITLLADAAKLLLAATRALLRHQPNPGLEVPPRSKSPRICNAGDKGGGECRPDARNLIKASACLATAMPSGNHSIELQNLLLYPAQLSAKR